MAIICSSKTISIFILCLSFSSVVLSITIANTSRLQLLPQCSGPASFAFDSIGGFYTGVFDGRILYYQTRTGFGEFGFTSPNRSKAVCDGTTNPDLGPLCGRPLGLGLCSLTNQLYLADAYYGLLVVGIHGGLATQLATMAEGLAFRFLFGLDIDQLTGIVYFTEFSTIYHQFTEAVRYGDATGRLMKHDPKTKHVTVLLRGLSGAAGVAISKDGSYILVSEFIGSRIQKYWLKGPKANTAEILMNLPGRPANIKRTILGNFWVAVNVLTQQLMQTTIPTTAQSINEQYVLSAQLINGSTGVDIGVVLPPIQEVFPDRFLAGTVMTEVQENRDTICIGTNNNAVDIVGTINLTG